jgi:hypothetical protein
LCASDKNNKFYENAEGQLDQEKLVKKATKLQMLYIAGKGTWYLLDGGKKIG